MADDPHTLSREAKTLAQALKENLNNREPWDKEIEFQRRNLQKQYLLLLLTHPRAKESKDVETLLWMQTSHVLIGPYKTRIAAIEKALRDASAQKQQSKRQQHGPVEHRKLVHRYRQYLAGEERFWMQLIARLHDQFALHEADHILARLGITSTEDAQGSRSHFQFPAPPTGSGPSPDAAERDGYIAILAKALVCLGDLARYRELASDAGPRRQDDTSKRGGRSNRGKQPAVPVNVVPRTLDKSRVLYEAARSLAPDDGNPPHQLAILALHKRDSFEGVVQNYRALCTRQPYVTASGNLTSILRGALKEYQKAQAAENGSASRRLSADTFKRDIVAFYASCRKEGDADLAQRLASSVASDYEKSISDRLLPVDIITKALTLAQGTLWHIAHDKAANELTYSSNASSLVLASLLSLFRVLFEIGAKELQEPMTPDGHDLAMRITAVLRRMLPALRVTGKWLRVKRNLDMVLMSSAPATQSFWQSYSAFFGRIAEVFPPDQLQPLERQLDEDVELVGYLPLGGLLISRSSPEVVASKDRRALEDVHPNEEQLMRIWDIWHDATLIEKIAPAQMQSFRAYSANRQPSKAQASVNVNVPPSRAPAAPRIPSRYPVARTASSVDEDARTETTDPVGDAFRQALGEDDDTDEEEILFNPRDSIMSVAPEVPEPHTIHVTPTKQHPLTSSTSVIPLSYAQTLPPTTAITPPGSNATGAMPVLATLSHPPVHRASFSSTTPALPHTPKTTAQDLLANVLGRGAPSRTARHVSQTSSFPPVPPTHTVSDPTTPSLLASNSPGAAPGTGHSIWSASADEHAAGTHHRRLSQSGVYSGGTLRSVSQPHPWTGTSERAQSQHDLYQATPPPLIHSAVPTAAYPTSLQQSTLQPSSGIGLGPPPSGLHARRRPSGSNTSSLLAQHSYLPPSSQQQAMYATPSYPQQPQQSSLLPPMMKMHLSGHEPLGTTPAAQSVGDMRAYNAIGGMSTGGARYAGNLQQAGLGLAGGIWGPAG